MELHSQITDLRKMSIFAINRYISFYQIILGNKDVFSF